MLTPARRLAALAVLAASATAACESSNSNAIRPDPSPPTAVTGATRMPVPTLPPETCDAAGVFCADPSEMERGVVLRIIDGDTLDVRIEGREERVRIFGIDTAERGEPCFAEASARLRVLAADDVLLVADARDRDRNGRLLRYVYTPAGLSIDAVMLSEGLATAWTTDGALRDLLIPLEARARVAQTGCLWRR